MKEGPHISPSGVEEVKTAGVAGMAPNMAARNDPGTTGAGLFRVSSVMLCMMRNWDQTQQYQKQLKSAPSYRVSSMLIAIHSLIERTTLG